MNHKTKRNVFKVILLNSTALALVSAVFSGPVLAGQTWDGGGSNANWRQDNNWDSDTGPDLSQTIFMNGNTRPVNNNNNLGVLTGGINFNAATTDFTVNGPNGANWSNDTISNNKDYDHTFSSSFSVTLSGDNEVRFGGGSGRITIEGDIDLDGGTRVLKVTGTDKENAATLTLGGVISEGGLTFVTGSDNNTAVVIIDGDNTYQGPTTIGGNDKPIEVRIRSSGALGAGTGGTTVLDGGTLALKGGITIEEDLRLNGTGTWKTGALRSIGDDEPNTVNGSITLDSATRIDSDREIGHLILNGGIDTNGYELTIRGRGLTTVATEGISGTGDVIKEGQGTVTLTAANDFTGTAWVKNGTLEITGAGALLATETINIDAGTDQSTNLPILRVDSGTAIKDTATVTISGGNEPCQDATLVVDESETIGTLNSGGEAAGAFVTLADGQTLTVDAGTFDGTVSGDGGLTKTGTGTLTLGGSNTYAGPTTLDGGSLVAGSDDAFGTGTLTIVAGTVGAADGARSLANAVSVTGDFSAGGVAAADVLTLSGAIDLGGGARTITVNDTTGDTGAADFDLALSGTLSNGAGIVKNGAGTLRLTGAGNATGGVTIDAGTLQVAGGSAIADTATIVVNDTGVFQVLADETIDGLTVDAGGTVDITHAGTVLTLGAFNGDFTVAAGAAVTGAGSVVKIGTGTQRFSGTVTGSTTINGGVLLIDAGTQLGDGNSGTGDDDVTVNDTGILQANGVLDVDTLTVNNGGMLRGTGTVNARTTIGGTLSPGSSPGTMTFNSSTTLTATAIGLFEIDGPTPSDNDGNPDEGEHDQIVISGAGSVFTADGTLVAVTRGFAEAATNPYLPSLGTKLTLVQATNGATIGGAFAAVTTPATGLPAGTIWDTIFTTSTIDLFVAPASYAALDAVGIGTTPNQKAAGVAVQAWRPAAGTNTQGTDRGEVFNALYGLSAAALPAALDAIGGDTLAGLGFSTIATANTLLRAISGHADQRREPEGGSHAGIEGVSGGEPAGAAQKGVWVRGFGGLGTLDGDGNGPGYDTRTGGLSGGVDYWVTDGVVIGADLGWVRSDIDFTNRAADGKLDSFRVGGSVGLTLGAFQLDGTAGYSVNSYDSRRRIALGTLNRTATGDWNGNTVDAGGRLGWRFDAGGVTVRPGFGLHYVGVSQAGFTETGAGTLNLAADPQEVESLRASIGIQASSSLAIGEASITPQFRIAYERELMDDHAGSSNAFTGNPGITFQTDSTRVGRDAVIGGIAISGSVLSNVSVFADYEGGYRTNEVSHTLRGGIRLKL